MIGWITDPHLSFIYDSGQFGKSLVKDFPEVQKWIITGDIAESNNFVKIMNDFQYGVDTDVYFVLGNHDYYGSSFQEMDAKVDAIDNDKLIWLKKGPVVFDNFALVGNSGWYDAGFGNHKTKVMLNDFNFIQELQSFDRISLIKSCQDRATSLASKLGQDLALAVEKHDNILIATHVPPFKEATWHQGKPSNNEWLPWFSSFNTGSMLANFADKYPDKKFIVLCGHCFDHETEVLTTKGWKTRNNLQENDIVITLNKETQNLEPNKILEFHDHDHDGEMIKIKSKSFDLLVTPEHGMVSVSRSGKLELPKANELIEKPEWDFINSSILNNEGLKTTRIKRESISTIPYKGKVWCITVPNGTLVVRRNGKVCVTQNTHGSGIYHFSENMTVFTGASKYRYPGVSGILDPKLFKLETNDFRLIFGQY